MKTYIKPYTYCTLLTEESHILAGSNPASTKPNQANSLGTGVFVGGSSSEYTGGSDANNNVSEMSKHYVPWTSWDDFDL